MGRDKKNFSAQAQNQYIHILKLLKLEESESSEWVADSDKETECQFDRYKTVTDVNGLSINMITAIINLIRFDRFY